MQLGGPDGRGVVQTSVPAHQHGVTWVSDSHPPTYSGSSCEMEIAPWVTAHSHASLNSESGAGQTRRLLQRSVTPTFPLQASALWQVHVAGGIRGLVLLEGWPFPCAE